jgi:hypothetical protein
MVNMDLRDERDVSGCGVFGPLGGRGHYCARCERADPCPIDPEQVSICRVWIREYCTPRKTINTSSTSYGLKHRVENFCRNLGTPHYISNGAFIAAALAEGYRAEANGGINARLAMRIWTAPADIRAEGRRP